MPSVRNANPYSFLFLFFLTLFVVSCIIIFLPIILIILIVVLFFALFAREKLKRANRKFRDTAFAHRYFHTRTAQAPGEEEETDPDVVDVGFTILNEDDPEKSGRSS